MKTNNNITTFWNFLKQNKIEIPIIQRDYAQGRRGKEELRRRFLNSIKNALDNPNNPLYMDFVYGSTNNKRLNLLDGQQRLTTLWLLHWYIAYKANKLTESVKDQLKNFSYETRQSSRTFCERLVDLEPCEKDIDIINHIINQTWFNCSWKQDPTIQAMLRMLGGTLTKKMTKKNEKSESILNNDGIEQVFNLGFGDYWEILLKNDSPIKFYYLDLNGLKISDDLYIKMNARGEQLTSFENFKADLIGYINEQSKLESPEQKEWSKFLDPKTGFPILMDSEWTDIFWDSKEKYCIDEIYYAFINRFFLNEVIVRTPTSQKKLNNSKIFNYLYGTDPKIIADENSTENNTTDSRIAYTGFISYKYAIKNEEHYNFNQSRCDKEGFIPIETFHSLYDTLCNFALFKKEVKNTGRNICDIFISNRSKSYLDSFIPEYQRNKRTTNYSGDSILEIKDITQTQRIIFHAICKFFEKIDNINESNLQSIEVELHRWMRIVWNIVDNANVDSVTAMIRHIRLINDLSRFCGKNVYEEFSKVTKSSDYGKLDYSPFIQKEPYKIYSKASEEQVDEEIIKVQQIWDEIQLRQFNNEMTWEEEIIDAEGTCFFNGTIRFLYQDNDWQNFDQRLQHAKIYFDSNGCRNDYSVKWIKAFLKNCKQWNEQWIKDYQLFNTSAKNLMFFFTSSQFSEPVNNCLLADDLENMPMLEWGDKNLIYEDKIREEILSDDFIKNVNRENPQARIKWYKDNMFLYKRNEGFSNKFIVLSWGENCRLVVLRKLVNDDFIKINNNIIHGNNGVKFWWGRNINFEFNNYIFQWWGKPDSNEADIYLIEQNGKNDEYIRRIQNVKDSDTSDLNKYYCFTVRENDFNVKYVIENMKNIIEEYEKEIIIIHGYINYR
jgi:hypothetical protein